MATIQVTLSNPWHGNVPGDVITVEVSVARGLVSAGYAKYTTPLDPPPSADLADQVAALTDLLGRHTPHRYRKVSVDSSAAPGDLLFVYTGFNGIYDGTGAVIVNNADEGGNNVPFTSDMVGMWIWDNSQHVAVPDPDTGVTTWPRIVSVDSPTQVTLDRPAPEDWTDNFASFSTVDPNVAEDGYPALTLEPTGADGDVLVIKVGASNLGNTKVHAATLDGLGITPDGYNIGPDTSFMLGRVGAGNDWIVLGYYAD